jgi:hypothetical protein
VQVFISQTRFIKLTLKVSYCMWSFRKDQLPEGAKEPDYVASLRRYVGQTIQVFGNRFSRDDPDVGTLVSVPEIKPPLDVLCEPCHWCIYIRNPGSTGSHNVRLVDARQITDQAGEILYRNTGVVPTPESTPEPRPQTQLKPEPSPL